MLSEDVTQADVIVPDFQLSLAIGKEGQNARLAARLTGVRIDIKSEQMAADEAAGIIPVDDDTEYEAGEWIANADTGSMEFHTADGTVVSENQWQAEAETGEAPEVVVTEVIGDEASVVDDGPSAEAGAES